MNKTQLSQPLCKIKKEIDKTSILDKQTINIKYFFFVVAVSSNILKTYCSLKLQHDIKWYLFWLDISFMNNHEFGTGGGMIWRQHYIQLKRQGICWEPWSSTPWRDTANKRRLIWYKELSVCVCENANASVCICVCRCICIREYFCMCICGYLNVYMCVCMHKC